MANHKISSTYNNTPVEVKWTNNDAIRTMITYQVQSDHWPIDEIDTSIPWDELPPHEFTFTDEQMLSELEAHLAVRLERYGKYLIDENPKKIISIGPGLSTFEAAVCKLNSDCHMYLVDRSEITYPEKFLHAENPIVNSVSPGYVDWGFRNSFGIVEDIFAATDINTTRFTELDPTDSWPDGDVDVVLSIFSWMWEYPKETYWQKAIRSLKTGGKLICTLKFIPDRDVVTEITNALGSEPVVIPWLIDEWNLDDAHKSHLTVVNGAYGGVYVWTKAN